MITRICFKFDGKEKLNNKISQKSKPENNTFPKEKVEDENHRLDSMEKLLKITKLGIANQINAIKEENRAIKEELKAMKEIEI